MGLNVNEVKLGVIGCGKMATAILGGIIENGFLSNKNIFVFDINKDASEKLKNDLDVNCVSSIKNLLETTNVILFAIKPFIVDTVLNEIKPFYDNQVIMSILAGVKLAKYESILPNSQVVRIMPNTPALVNEGMSAICSNNRLKKENLDFAYNFMKNCGQVIVTTEDKIDIITALSGSGPAFYFRIIDLLAKSAVKLGLDEKEALLLSTQTALGSAKMVLQNDFNIEQLIKNVTTPGGCTEVGNNVLNNSNLDEIFDKTIKDTMQKAIDLG